MIRNAIAGGILWFGLAIASRLHGAPLTIIELLFLLGPLVVIPLGLALCDGPPRRAGISLFGGGLRWFQLAAALSATASFWLPRGIVSAAFAAPWLGFGCVVGIRGLLNLFDGGFKSLKSACMAVSFLYLPIGCIWLVASRLGLNPLGFQEPIVLLTAVHFHFAGFAAPLLALSGLTALEQRMIAPSRVYKSVTAGVLAGPALLAAGFVIGPRVKLAAALVVACSEIGLSLCFLSQIRYLKPRAAQTFISVSALSVLFAMILVGGWAIGEFPLQPFLHLDEMARFHGTANALGFVLCGLVGWNFVGRYSRHQKGASQ
jgi:hypothetical protein